MRLLARCVCLCLAFIALPDSALAQRLDALPLRAFAGRPARPDATPNAPPTVNGCPAGRVAAAAGGGAVLGLMAAALFHRGTGESSADVGTRRVGSIAGAAIAGATLVTVFAVSNGTDC